MSIMISTAIIANIAFIIILSVGLFYNFKLPKNKATFGYSFAGSMILCIISLSLVAIYCLFARKILYAFILILCIVSPFIIGKLVKYETLKKYTVAQIICFVVSLVILLQIS